MVAAWLLDCQREAALPPRRPRVPLLCEAGQIGSVEDEFLQPLRALTTGEGQPLLSRQQLDAQPAWCLHGAPQAALAQLATALRDAGLAGRWRHEQLAVRTAKGQQVATVERAVVRPLGIGTRAVHLCAGTRDGRVWVQQRAFDKPNDPGLWDTLMGGMISAADTLELALERETHEEAGLALSQLQDIRLAGQIRLRRPHDDGGAGFVDEVIDWFSATVPDGVLPDNQDGEVEQFELLTRDALLARLARREFTLEASLILAAYLKLEGA